MRHNIFYMENPHKLVEIKKPQGIRPTNLNPLFKSSYTNLPNRFTLKTYFSVPTT